MADWAHVPITGGMVEILESIKSSVETDQESTRPLEEPPKGSKPLNNILENTSLSCHQLAVSVAPGVIASEVGKSDRQVKNVLADLADAGLIKHIGDRGGWVLTDSGRAFLSPSPIPLPPEVP